MKRTWILVALLCAGCGQNKFQQEVELERRATSFASEVDQGDYEFLTVEELKKLMDAKTDMVLVDTMPPDSFAKEHIAGAVNFLFPKEGTMTDWKKEQTGGQDVAAYEKLLGPDKKKLVVIYCGYVKCLRSHNGALWAKKLGYTNVKRCPGGLYAWIGAGYPLVAGN